MVRYCLSACLFQRNSTWVVLIALFFYKVKHKFSQFIQTIFIGAHIILYIIYMNLISVKNYTKLTNPRRFFFINIFSFFFILFLQCWDQCTQNTKINTNLNAWPLRTVSMVRNESLVTADVAWQLLNTPCQYLVTWEISGGGLKGNLITETPSVQLSLWPDTVYRVQVTCRNKVRIKVFFCALN